MERLMKASELSALTGIPTGTLYHMAQADRIPHVRFGKLVRFPEEEIVAWVTEHMHAPRVEPKKEAKACRTIRY